MYHRVVPCPPRVPAPTYNVPPEQFRRQLAGVLERGFRPMRLAEVLDRRRRGAVVPAGTFVVTFDDAHASVVDYALPVLEELDVPATVFVATAYIDTEEPVPFDDWTAAGATGVPAVSWRIATTEQCRAMQRGGLIELGCHTHSHGDFRGRPDAFAEDVRQSLDVLRDRFGLVCPPLAFPFGAVDAAMLRVARDLGLPCSLTTRGRCPALSDDPHGWGRFDVASRDTPAMLATKLGGWYDWIRGMGQSVEDAGSTARKCTAGQASSGTREAGQAGRGDGVREVLR